jgi:hypothetical protein
MIINGKKIKAKEIMEMTGRSERTVRKYFLNLVTITKKQQWIVVVRLTNYEARG